MIAKMAVIHVQPVSAVYLWKIVKAQASEVDKLARNIFRDTGYLVQWQNSSRYLLIQRPKTSAKCADHALMAKIYNTEYLGGFSSSVNRALPEDAKSFDKNDIAISLSQFGKYQPSNTTKQHESTPGKCTLRGITRRVKKAANSRSSPQR